MTEHPTPGRERNRRPPERQVLESPLSATWRPSVREKAVLVGVGPGIAEDDLDELAALADSAGAEPVARLVQSRAEPDPATFIGKGRLDDLHGLIHSNGAEVVILDHELTPGQLRSLEERMGVKVIDRTALILDIFALHARSREGRAQVELAQLNYLLPRLRGWGEALSRSGGGIGTRMGGGETKLEIDRQHIRRRITKLGRDIKAMSKTRETKRARRQGSGIPQASIAGYTNAGKSTLLNALTGADVLVADQLFATLDPTVRRLKLPNGRRCTVSDTVGFVSKLPHDLVEAFRSTLEEVSMAELVVHVADAASPDLVDQVDAVRRVLGEIGAGDIPEVLVLNKIDRVGGSDRARLARRFPGSVPVSALTGEGVGGLLETLEEALPHPPVEVTLLVPYVREDLVARLYRDAEVLEVRHEDEGSWVHARVGLRELAAVREFVRSERRRGA
jgi:GTP-binding protein HflX